MLVMNCFHRLPALLTVALLAVAAPAAEPPRSADVIVYGGTSAAIAAAVQAEAMGKSVVIVSPDTHVGGLSSGGLGWTDSGKKQVIGGLARDFYRRLKRHYDSPEAWVHQKPEHYKHYRPQDDAIWVFEPTVAEETFEAWLRERDIPIVRDAWLDRAAGVAKDGDRIVSITTLDAWTFAGRMFIDATYEGDLMAAAGVSFATGREANATYGETLNGVQTKRAKSHQFANKISPYIVPDDPSSGLLSRIHDGSPGEEGAGDQRIQAYNFRLCMTDVAANRVPFPQPAGYDPLQYELLLRDLQAGSRHIFGKFDPSPNGKTDTNNHGSFSTDNIGMNYDYPEASYERRREIIAEHTAYQQGCFWFLTHDPRVPEEVRAKMGQWGLAKDEFVDNGLWPHQIYVREARRMVSDFVIAEPHLRGSKPTPDSVGMGSMILGQSAATAATMAMDRVGRRGGRATRCLTVERPLNMVAHMKTTIDIADDLLLRAKQEAKASQTTLRSLIEAGLREILGRSSASKRQPVEPVTYRGEGLRPEFRGKGWDTVREAIYGSSES